MPPVETFISLAKMDNPKPSRYQAKLHNPRGGTQPNHVLYIDLASIVVPPPQMIPKLERNPEFLLSVRDAVISSNQDSESASEGDVREMSPPIDAVSILNTRDAPNAELWEALAQARVSHLELMPHPGDEDDMERQCNYAGLGKLGLEQSTSSRVAAWPLKSLYLDAECGDGAWYDNVRVQGLQQRPSFPAVFAKL